MIPLRACVNCKELHPQSEMIRIMFANETKTAHVQPSSRLHGRSTYICYNKSCITSCLKKEKLQKALHKKLNDEITEMLQRIAK